MGMMIMMMMIKLWWKCWSCGALWIINEKFKYISKVKAAKKSGDFEVIIKVYANWGLLKVSGRWWWWLALWYNQDLDHININNALENDGYEENYDDNHDQE